MNKQEINKRTAELSSFLSVSDLLNNLNKWISLHGLGVELSVFSTWYYPSRSRLIYHTRTRLDVDTLLDYIQIGRSGIYRRCGLPNKINNIAQRLLEGTVSDLEKIMRDHTRPRAPAGR